MQEREDKTPDERRSAMTWAQRLKKQVKQLDRFKDFSNYNIATGGDSLVVDIDLDCPEALLLADYFIPSTNLEFGRASTPRSHRLLKVIDLTKKNTRTFFDFKGDVKSKKKNKSSISIFSEFKK